MKDYSLPEKQVTVKIAEKKMTPIYEISESGTQLEIGETHHKYIQDAFKRFAKAQTIIQSHLIKKEIEEKGN